MHRNFRIVKIDFKYCDFLRQFDNKVPYNAGSKELRPFIGVLFMIGKCEYFAPLSSPKKKHKELRNTIDLLKIENGKYGVINFNNMIPVMSSNYIEFDLNKKTEDKSEMKRIELLNNQLRWLTSNRKVILTKSKLLYDLYKCNKLSKNAKDRCCNFIMLEEKCKEFNEKK